MALLLGPALRRMRHPLFRAAAEPVFLQLAARRLRDLPRLRARDRHRLRPHRPGRVEDAARRRDPPLAISQLSRVPGRYREVREEARRSARRSLPRSRSERAPVGARRRARVGELEKILAGRLVRRRALLPLAGDQGLQDARARALVALPRLHALFGLQRRAPEARGAAVARWDEGGRRPRARSRAALYAAGREIRRRRAACASGSYGALPGPLPRRPYPPVLRTPPLASSP